MDKGRPWDDLWWMFLYVLSKLAVVIWIVFSAVSIFALTSMVYWMTQRVILVPIIALWLFIMSRIGLEWVHFYWNKILVEEHKLTSVGSE